MDEDTEMAQFSVLHETLGENVRAYLTDATTEWLWEVWTDHGYVMGTGSLTAAVKRAYYAIEHGDGACIKSCTGRIIPITERRSDQPGTDQGNRREDGQGFALPAHLERGVTTCEGFGPVRGRDQHPIFGPHALSKGLQSI